MTLFPVLWVVRMSFTPNKQILSGAATPPPGSGDDDELPRVLGLVDSATAVKLGGSGQKINFLRFLFNSLFVSIDRDVLAWSSSRRPEPTPSPGCGFPGANALFGVYISALMVPSIVMIIPNFILMKDLGWLNTYMGIMAPALLMTPYAVFFLRQFFLGINPRARGGGADRRSGQAARLLQDHPADQRRVPHDPGRHQLRRPVERLHVAAHRRQGRVGAAADRRARRVPLPDARRACPDWGGLMAGTTLAIVPTLVLFLALGRRIVNSINFSGFR